jgi:hypothetical protein
MVRRATASGLVPLTAFRWTYPRWTLAGILAREPDGLPSRDLWRRFRGQGAHPRSALDALRAAGFVTLEEESDRQFHARLTADGAAALAAERERRRDAGPTKGPILPPRDADGRLRLSWTWEPVPTHAPGDLWRSTVELLRFLRDRRPKPTAASVEYPRAS